MKKMSDPNEKNYNDTELAEIMKEIEGLEQGFAPETLTESTEERELLELGKNLKALSVGPSAVIPEKKPIPEKEDRVKDIPRPPTMCTANKKSNMDFKISGEMEMSITFHFGDEVVYLNVSQSEGLNLETQSGAHFSFPLVKKIGLRQAS
jgi:hypothetical protein